MTFTFTEQHLVAVLGAVVVGLLAIVIRYGIRFVRRVNEFVVGWLVVFAGVAVTAFGIANWTCYVEREVTNNLPGFDPSTHKAVMEQRQAQNDADRARAVVPWFAVIPITFIGIPIGILGIVLVSDGYEKRNQR